MKNDIINIYCDESHPNQFDGQDFMVLGALICDKRKYNDIKVNIQKIRLKHQLGFDYEFKWQKVNRKRLAFYIELIDFIADCDDLRLKINFAMGKRILDFNYDGYNYDKWYHLMYYYMLKNFIDYHKEVCENKNFVLLIDKRDTHSQKNYEKIATQLNRRFFRSKNKHSFKAVACESREFLLIQCVDIIIGAISYYHKRNYVNKPKTDLMRYIMNKFGIDFEKTTPIEKSDKVSFFIWKPRGLKIK